MRDTFVADTVNDTTDNNKQGLSKPPPKKMRKSLIFGLRQQVHIV